MSRQEQSLATIERIHAATAQLLLDGGLLMVTTNGIADLAGVNIATVYHHFDDKFDIVRSLSEMSSLLERAAMTAALSAIDPSDPIVTQARLLIETLHQARCAFGASVALRAAVRAAPQLRDLASAANELLAENLARWLQMQRPSLRRRLTHSGLRALSEVIDRLLDTAIQLDDLSLVDEAVLLTSARIELRTK